MKTITTDGRIFETQPFLKIEFNPNELVYKYIFELSDRVVKSSAGHKWCVWDKKKKKLKLKKMEKIDIENDELLLQSWK